MAQAGQRDMNPMSSAEQCGILMHLGRLGTLAKLGELFCRHQIQPKLVHWLRSLGCTWLHWPHQLHQQCGTTAAAPSATRLPSFGAGLGAALPELPPLGPFSCDFTWRRSYAELQIPRTTMTIQHEVEKPRAKV